MKIKKNDQVLIISGNDKGKKGKVLRSLPKEGKVVIEKVAVTKKHVRPKRQGQKGQVISMERPVNVSNVQIICPKCNKPTRIGEEITKDKKIRVCKKCGKEI